MPHRTRVRRHATPDAHARENAPVLPGRFFWLTVDSLESPAGPECAGPLPPATPSTARAQTVWSGAITPYWLAMRASAMLSWICNLVNKRDLWVLTVLALRLRRRAMSS